jgi:hypothetical protein
MTTPATPNWIKLTAALIRTADEVQRLLAIEAPAQDWEQCWSGLDLIQRDLDRAREALRGLRSRE